MLIDVRKHTQFIEWMLGGLIAPRMRLILGNQLAIRKRDSGNIGAKRLP